jgi:RNA polymerase-binding transcription factor DksA
MTDAELIGVMKQNGIVKPAMTLRVAREVELALPLACALLEQESSGGHNVFGHDNVRNPIKGGDVTKARYLQYKRYRELGLGSNGVGPTQLTWSGYQDRADELGGCWVYDVNLRVGFGILRANIQRSGVYRGYWNYNGGEAYARQVMPKVQKWQALLGAPARGNVPSMEPDRARELLAAERTRIERELAQLGHQDDGEAADEFDEANRATDLYQDEFDEGRAGDVREQLAAVERAEARLAAGTYGVSIESGQPIPDERLEAAPMAERTADEERRLSERRG